MATELKNDPVAIFFSGGKDSIAATDLWLKYHKGDKHFVYLYYVPELSFVDKILKYYESRWGIKIEQRPCYETKSMLAKRKINNGEKIKKYHYMLGDDEREFLKEKDLKYSVWGMKKNDSLSRRIFLSRSDEIINRETGRICPIVDWTEKQAAAYCKLNKLPLMSTYGKSGSDGHSFWIPKLLGLVWLRSTYPDDFKKIINYFPELESLVFRHDNNM